MRPLVAGNWKMHETASEGKRLAEALLRALDPGAASRVTVAVAPPFTALAAVGDVLAGSPVALAAQNAYWEDAGAYTGEISVPMLLDLGVQYVIVGHSERRRYFGETDDDVRRKLAAALRYGVRPILAVGETAEERDAGATDERVQAQTRAALDGVARERLADVAIAYEPVWAIGTGRNCDPQEAQRVLALIRGCVAGLDASPLLYGGSVNPSNFASYLALPDCNGGLIGGASLDAAGFASMVALAAQRAS